METGFVESRLLVVNLNSRIRGHPNIREPNNFRGDDLKIGPMMPVSFFLNSFLIYKYRIENLA